MAGLQGVGVIEARRGQGFGTLITTIATRAGMAVGNRIIWLSVDDDNATAVGIYDGSASSPPSAGLAGWRPRTRGRARGSV